MSEQTTIAPGAEAFVDQFAALKAELPGAGAPAVVALREAGLRRFSAVGCPNKKTEAGKYTTLRPLPGIGVSIPPALDEDRAGAGATVRDARRVLFAHMKSER